MARQLAVIAIAMIAYLVFTRVSSITKRPSTVNG